MTAADLTHPMQRQLHAGACTSRTADVAVEGCLDGGVVATLSVVSGTGGSAAAGLTVEEAEQVGTWLLEEANRGRMQQYVDGMRTADGKPILDA